MSTTRLKIYNGALTYFLGERKLASLTEDRKPRHLLDGVWDDGGVDFCLEQADWNFATNTIQLDYTPSIQPDFGYRRAFTKPTDWVSTSMMCTDEFFTTPLLHYADEIQHWFADLDTIYVAYVSNAAGYGTNYAAWPASFTDYVKAVFARKIVTSMSGSREDLANMFKVEGKLLSLAKNKDAKGQPTKFPPEGAWNRSRRGLGGGRGDRGNRGNLIG